MSKMAVVINKKGLLVLFAMAVLLVVALGCSRNSGSEASAKTTLTHFLFTQNAQSGTFTPISNADGSYNLTLKDVDTQTVYFSDKPKGIAGQISTPDIVTAWGAAFEGFGGTPLMAALQALDSNNKTTAIALQLSDPTYDDATRSLQFKAKIAPKGSIPSQIMVLQKSPSESLPDSFGKVTLFLDDSRQSIISHLVRRTSLSAINVLTEQVNTLNAQIDRLNTAIATSKSDAERTVLLGQITQAENDLQTKLSQLQKATILAINGFTSIDTLNEAQQVSETTKK